MSCSARGCKEAPTHAQRAALARLRRAAVMFDGRRDSEEELRAAARWYALQHVPDAWTKEEGK